MSVRMVLLPGMDGTSLMYRRLVATLPARSDPYLIAYPPDVGLSYDELVDRTVTELAHLPRAVLIAESFSGPIALRVAQRLGAAVIGIVLIASFLENPTGIPRWMTPFAHPSLFRVNPPRWLLRWLLLGSDAPAALQDELAHAIALVSPDVMAARIRGVLSLPTPHDVHLPGLPVLYLRAAKDRLISPSAVQAITATGAVTKVVDLDATHLLAQREPEVVWREICTFLATLPTE